MIKKLCTILLAAVLAVPSMAQQEGRSKKDGVVFGPQKGQWQISMVLGGSNSFYNENTGSYLLPSYNNFGGAIGLPNGGQGGLINGADQAGQGDNSGYLNDYLNINGFNGNSLVNIVGLQAKYFLTDCWDINLSLGFNINITPKKDFIEGDTGIDDMVIPDQKYINAQATNNWYVNIGTDRYFKTRNARIHPYVGATVGFQMARIETTEPYTGKFVYDEDLAGDNANDIIDYDDEGKPIYGDEDALSEQQVYLAAGKVGQMFGLKVAGVAGIEYSLTPGLILGFEFQPLAYRYDVIQIAPQGFDKYNVSHHNIKLFDMPVLKLGFRF